MAEKVKDLIKWKGISHSCIGRLTIVMMAISPKQSTHLVQSLSKSQLHFFFFIENDKLILKLMQDCVG